MTYLPRSKYFSEKSITMIFMYLFAPFNTWNFKKYLEWSGALRTHYNYVPKMIHLSQPGIFLEKPIIKISCTKLKKNTVDPDLKSHTIFAPKMAHLPQKIFFEKHWYKFYVPFALSLMNIFKKVFKVDSVLWRRWGFLPKIAHLPQMRIFFQKKSLT